MIDAKTTLGLMKLAVDEARKSKGEDHGVHPYVGAILAAGTGEIIATAHRGETGRGRHAEFIILTKASEAGVDLTDAELFVTLEPCTARGQGKTPCAQRIIDSGIKRVHIGMLDPNPQILGRGEIYLRWAELEVERFPHELIAELEVLNAAFVKLHKDAHIPNDSLYVTTQVSDIISQELQREGLDVKDLPYAWDVSIEDLIQYCTPSYSANMPWDLNDLLHRTRGQAYDKKYADYSYVNDARSVATSWKDELLKIIERLGIDSLSSRRVLNVGIGNGLEGLGLFEKIDEFTAVDIAPRSLEYARKRLPNAKTFVASAENLKQIRTGSQDIYISLRTYGRMAVLLVVLWGDQVEAQ